MKNAVQKSPQGWAGKQVRGWAFRFGVFATGAVCCLSTASAASSSVTHLKYLQTLVQLCGESAQFTASSKAADYIQWAKNKNISVNWNAKATLSSSDVAQSLVQLYGLNPRKYGGDYVRILEREGIVIEPSAAVSNETLASLVDNPQVIAKSFQVAASSTTPVKPGNGNGGGYGWYAKHGVPKPPPHDRGLGRGQLPTPR
jgi:hypothetical protein